MILLLSFPKCFLTHDSVFQVKQKFERANFWEGKNYCLKVKIFYEKYENKKMFTQCLEVVKPIKLLHGLLNTVFII